MISTISRMSSMRSCCLVVLSWFFCIHILGAANTLGVGQVMRDWEFIESSNKLFRLQFFSLQASNRYLGIKYMNGSLLNAGNDHVMVVWVANRGNPLEDTSGVLNISQDGNLVLTVHNGTFITLNAEQPAMSSNTTATLLDMGNLVLKAGDRIVWQSFDYPSDKWLPGMKLGSFNLDKGQPQHRFLTSFISPQAATRGAFSLGVDPNYPKQLVILRRGVLYWQTGYNFSNFPQMIGYGILRKFSFNYFSNESQSYFTYTRNDNSSSWIEMGSSGTIGIFWTDDQGLTFLSTDPCEADQSEYVLRGCATLEPSNCKGGDMFKQTSGTMNSWSNIDNSSLGISDCEEICRRDCSCKAYASSFSDGTGCKFAEGYYNIDSPNEIIYIRNSTVDAKAPVPSYPPSYTGPDHRNNTVPNHQNHTTPWNPRKIRLWLTIGGAVLLILASVFLLCYLRWRNRHFGGNNGRRKDGRSQRTQSLIDELKSSIAIFDKISNGKKDHDLPLFSLSSIEIATDYFSGANEIGKGGFGPVYKGKLVNGQEIAVKRLSRSSKQGLEEFKNEVILISRLQHRNLVKLLGCCIEGDERILIYEYMSNKSLDSILSDVTGRALLDWKKRVCIIEGIAQGLLYLHKYSRLRIIHRDLKTANILLDNNLNPKISDFGTARIFGDNESRANTNRIVGTYGYMSPEYALDGLFSVKSDVFSFGVMMLEIISGKMNTGFYQPDRAMNLLGYAWDLWKEGRSSEIMDPKLVETCSTSEVMRYIQVGFLCVQESAGDRPTMSEVVSMLSNEMITIPVPKQPAFSIIVSVNHAITPEIPKPCSINGVTISEVEAR